MSTFDVLAGLPQFIGTETPRTLFNALSGCFLTECLERPGFVLRSGADIATLTGAGLDKYVALAQAQAAALRL